jgi:hypothetical protein
MGLVCLGYIETYRFSEDLDLTVLPTRVRTCH